MPGHANGWNETMTPETSTARASDMAVSATSPEATTPTPAGPTDRVDSGFAVLRRPLTAMPTAHSAKASAMIGSPKPNSAPGVDHSVDADGRQQEAEHRHRSRRATYGALRSLASPVAASVHGRRQLQRPVEGALQHRDSDASQTAQALGRNAAQPTGLPHRRDRLHQFGGE